jgi:hypothetical protein
MYPPSNWKRTSRLFLVQLCRWVSWFCLVYWSFFWSSLDNNVKIPTITSLRKERRHALQNKQQTKKNPFKAVPRGDRTRQKKDSSKAKLRKRAYDEASLQLGAL